MGHRNTRWFVWATLLLGLFGVGLAYGWTRPLFPDGAATKEIEGFVRDLGGEIASDRVEAIWDRLTPTTRKYLEHNHVSFLEGVATYVSRREQDRSFEHCVRMLEREYGMDVEALGRTVPKELWVSQTRRRLGTSEELAAYASLRIERIESDGVRIRVWASLPDGRPQGLHLERLDGRLSLTNFVPYGEIEQMERPLPRSSAAASQPSLPDSDAPAPATR